MIVALIALAVALSGTALAANGLINAAQIKDHSISAGKLTYRAIAQLRGARGQAGANGGFDPNKVTYLISAPQSVGPSSLKTVIADCPAGTKAVGGGGGVSGGQLVSSVAAPNGTGWAIGVVNPYSETINQVYAFAVCAAP
jgi:hypothetical protein